MCYKNCSHFTIFYGVESIDPNSPQRLLPLIMTVTTATTSKSGSREPDLFFSLLFLKQNTLCYLSFLSLNDYVLCTRKLKNIYVIKNL